MTTITTTGGSATAHSTLVPKVPCCDSSISSFKASVSTRILRGLVFCPELGREVTTTLFCVFSCWKESTIPAGNPLVPLDHRLKARREPRGPIGSQAESTISAGNPVVLLDHRLKALPTIPAGNPVVPLDHRLKALPIISAGNPVVPLDHRLKALPTIPAGTLRSH
jgi:hypothetical protein